LKMSLPEFTKKLPQHRKTRKCRNNRLTWQASEKKHQHNGEATLLTKSRIT
jgi:hypothetical protein